MLSSAQRPPGPRLRGGGAASARGRHGRTARFAPAAARPLASGGGNAPPPRGPRRRVCDGGDGEDDYHGGGEGREWRRPPLPPARLLHLAAAALGLLLLAPAGPASARERERSDPKRRRKGKRGGDEGAGAGGAIGGLLALLGIQGIVGGQQGPIFGSGGGGGGGGPAGIDSSQIDAFVNSMAAMWRPIAANLGFSGVVGACSAAALKTVGRSVAAFLGFGLIGLQVLAYYGIVTVNWTKVHEQARRVLDSTGDGRLDTNDYASLVKRGMVVLSQGLPSTSGFLAGFWLGLRFL